MASFSAGTATVDVIPSLSGFNTRMRKELASITAVKVPIEPDLDGFQSKLQAALPKNTAVKVGLDLDTAKAEAGITRFSGKNHTTTVKANADTKTAAARINALVDRHREAQVGVNVDTSLARAALAGFQGFAKSAMIAGIGGGATAAVGIAGAALAALPGLVAVAGGAFGALAVGVQGVGDAFKAFSKAEEGATKNAHQMAQAQQQAARTVASAQRSVEQAKTSLSRAYENAAWAAQSANQQVAAAERSLANAQRASQRAQESLTRAREDAAEAMEDLNLQVRGGALAEREAKLNLAEAEKRLAQARREGESGTDMKRAVLGVDQARLAVDKAVERNQDLAQTQQEAAQAGIEGSDQVVAAKRRVAEADRGIRDAQRQLAQAQQQAAQTQIRSQRAIADAQKGVTQAQIRLNQAMRDMSTAGVPAVNEVRQAMAKLAPQAQAFVRQVRALKPEWESLKRATQGALFAGLGTAFADFARTILPTAQAGLVGIASAMNSAAKAMMNFLSSGPMIQAFEKMFAGIAGVIRASVKPMQQFISLFMMMSNASMPGIAAIIQAFGSIAASIQSALAPLVGSGAFNTALQQFAGVLRALGPIIGTVLAVAVRLMNAIGPVFQKILAALNPALQAFGNILVALGPALGKVTLLLVQQLAKGLQAILPHVQRFAQWMAQSPGLALGLAAGLFGLVKAIGAIGGVVSGLGTLLTVAAGLKTALGAAGGLSGILTKLGGAFRFLLGPVGIILGIFTTLFATNEQFRQSIMRLLGVFGQLIGQFVSALMPIVRVLMGLFKQILNTAIMPLFNMLAAALVPIINTLAGIFQRMISALLPPFQSIIQALMPVIKILGQIFGTLIQALMPIVQMFAQLLATILPPLINIIAAVLVPVIKFLANIFKTVLAWYINHIVLPALKGIQWAVSHLGDAMNWLWKNVIKPVWDAISGAIKWAWDHVLKPVFDFFSRAIDNTKKSFENFGKIVTGIWDGIKSAVKSGVQIVIDIVWNNSLRKVAQLANKIPGVGSIIPDKWVDQPIKLARGGTVPGYSPGNDVVPAMLSPGEGVLMPQTVKMLGGASAINRLNRFGEQRFAKGGVVGKATPAKQGEPVTVDPAALAALGKVAKAVTATLTRLATVINTLLRTALAALMRDVLKLQLMMQQLALKLTLDWQKITLAMRTSANRIHARQILLQIQLRNSWNAVTAHTWASVRSQNAALDALMLGMRRTRDAMKNTADWADTQWHRMRAAAADPVRWVLHNPFNAGIIAAWNKLDADFSLGKHVSPVPVPFASGGRVHGAGSGTSDSIRARLSAGEFVVREDIAKHMYPFLKALNSGQPEAMQATGYAQGGVVADTGSALNAALLRGSQFAKAQHGKPYIWGGVGPQGYDCSGYMAAITNVLRNQDPHRRLGTTWTMPWPGFAPGLKSAFSVGVSDSGVGHTAGTLSGVNVEAGGSPSRTKYGINAVGADHPQFTRDYHLPVVGGKFVPGGGGFDPAAIVGPYFADTYKMIGQIATLFAGNVMGAQSGGVAKQGADGVKNYGIDRLRSMLAVTASAGSPEVVSAVRAVASQYGWGSGAEWRALSQLIANESSWNPSAANPSSSARGLFQKMTHIHGPVAPTVAGQTQWGLNYISGRYGSPVNALGAWQSRSPHWYDSGGIARGMGFIGKATLEPERILSGPQTRAFDALVESITGSSGASVGGNERPYIGEMTVVTQGGASASEIFGEAMHQVRHASKGVYGP